MVVSPMEIACPFSASSCFSIRSADPFGTGFSGCTQSAGKVVCALSAGFSAATFAGPMDNVFELGGRFHVVPLWSRDVSFAPAGSCVRRVDGPAIRAWAFFCTAGLRSNHLVAGFGTDAFFGADSGCKRRRNSALLLAVPHSPLYLLLAWANRYGSGAASNGFPAPAAEAARKVCWYGSGLGHCCKTEYDFARPISGHLPLAQQTVVRLAQPIYDSGDHHCRFTARPLPAIFARRKSDGNGQSGNSKGVPALYQVWR